MNGYERWRWDPNHRQVSWELQLPEGLEAVSEGAFKWTHYEKVVLPSTCKKIGEAAFAGCSKLKEVVLPEGLRSIGAYAFDSCSRLESIHFPDSIRSIGKYAFLNTGLREVKVPGSLAKNSKKNPGQPCLHGVFANCRQLQKVVWPYGKGSGDTLLEAFGWEDSWSRVKVKELIADKFPTVDDIPARAYYVIQDTIAGRYLEKDPTLPNIPYLEEMFELMQYNSEATATEIRYMIAADVLPLDRTSEYLERARVLKDPVLTAAILEYQEKHSYYAGQDFDLLYQEAFG